MGQRRTPHLGSVSGFQPWRLCLTPAHSLTALAMAGSSGSLQRVGWSSRAHPCKHHAFGISSPGASPGSVMGYRACHWAKQSLRQELSLSGGCLVTLMEKELWGPHHRNHSLAWQAHRKAQVPRVGAGGGWLQKPCPWAPVCRWWRDGQRSLELKEELDQGLDLLSAELLLLIKHRH